MISEEVTTINEGTNVDTVDTELDLNITIFVAGDEDEVSVVLDCQCSE